jgi:hypothetical protein
MIISVPVGILHLLLFNAADTSAFTSIKSNKRIFAKTSDLRASYDRNDRYSNVLDAYQKKSPASVPVPVPEVPVDSLSLPDDISSVQDVVKAVNDAASSAIEASNQATEAANSIAVPAAALGAKITAAKATAIAATAAASSLDSTSDKTPTLVEYFTHDLPSKIGSIKSSGQFLSPDTKEKLILLKNNLIPAATPSGETITKASIEGGGAAFSLPSFDYNFDIDSVEWSQFVDKLQFEEYGAWYVTAFSLLFAINQREAGRQDAADNFQEEIMAAREKADEAANAAVLAADGAKQAKDLVMNIPKVEKGGDSMLNLSKLRNLEVDNVSTIHCA